jgi:hypothetical protein
MLVLFVLPLLVALSRLILPDSRVLIVSAWVCPFVCAALVAVVCFIQYSMDKVLGLHDGVLNAPVKAASLAWSSVISGASIFAFQMIIFSVILGVIK